MKVLSIGNSFSQDAQRYIHELAGGEGVSIKTVNLYIGGCSLRRHYINMLDDVADYAFEFNGQNTGIKVSIREALASDDWDIVTLQQASYLSIGYESYTPYLESLADYVRKYCPHAKIFIHQTWAYEDGSEKLAMLGKYATASEMMADVRASYTKAAEEIGADGIIPSGEAMLRAAQSGAIKMHRDGFHASRGAGRYLLALTWYKTLTGSDISANRFDALDEPITEDEREILIAAVNG